MRGGGGGGERDWGEHVPERCSYVANPTTVRPMARLSSKLATRFCDKKVAIVEREKNEERGCRDVVRRERQVRWPVGEERRESSC